MTDILQNLEMTIFCCIFVMESQRYSSNHTFSSFHSCHHHLNFMKPKSVGRNSKTVFFSVGYGVGFSVGSSVGSSVGCISITI